MRNLLIAVSVVALTGFSGTAYADNLTHSHGDHSHAHDHGHAIHNTAKAHADLINNDGEVIGHADFKQGADGVLIHVAVQGLPPGEKGFHIHAVGDCGVHNHGESQAKTDFNAAKGHITSEGRQHGLLNPEGHHEGDLPNLIVADDGTAHAEVTAHGLTLLGGELALLDEDGSAIMIHAEPDDHMSQPIGGSGARISCGVIQAYDDDHGSEGHSE